MATERLIRRDLRPAEAAGSDTEPERIIDKAKPSSNPVDNEWDGYMPRKLSVGSQQSYGMMRNDRTPLNTPYTPHLVKLQLKRHDENEQFENQSHEPAREFVATIKASVVHLVRPLGHVRTAVDRVLGRLLPRSAVRSAFFTKHREWIVWYLTTVLCIPFVLLLSPMIIAFCICTSPIWIAGVVVLAVRTFVPFWKHETIADEFVHSPGPNRLNGGTHTTTSSGAHTTSNGIGNGNGTHHSSSMYRRTVQIVDDVAAEG